MIDALRCRALIAPFVLLLLVLTAAPALSAEDRYGQGLLWRIETPHGQTNHLFGSIHSSDERVHVLPPALVEAFDASETAAFELVLDADVMRSAAKAMFSREGPPLEAIVGSQLFQEAGLIAAKYQIPTEALQQLRPWAAIAMFSVPPSELHGGPSLDERLQHAARSQGKRVVALETVDEQVAAFESFTEGQEIDLFRSVITEHGHAMTVYEQLLEAYLERDISTIRRLSDAPLAALGPELLATFRQGFLDERNERMVDRMEPLLLEGGAFVVVGALHLIGDTGMLHLLEQRGYRISRVY